MIRNLILSGFFLLMACSTLSSCETKSVDEDMNEYCNCVRDAAKNERKFKECQDKMIEISLKYEFDPEAVEVIQNRVSECK